MTKGISGPAAIPASLLSITDPLGCGDAGLCSVLLEVDEGIQLWDLNGRKLYFNPATLRQFGPAAAESDITCEVLSRQCLDEAGLPFQRVNFPVARVVMELEACSDQLVQLAEPVNGCRWLRINARRLPAGGANGEGLILSSSVDVTPLIEQGRLLEQQAHYDPLTQLPNRVLLADRMKLALGHSLRTGELLAVCLMDLDGFKPINDTLGHKAGDALLQEIARRLQEAMRADDTAARIGGDEFALLLGGFKSPEQCEHALRRVLEAVALPCAVEGQSVRVSGSLGVTLFPGDSADPDQLLRHADQAMYKAKEAGKNRFHVFNPAIESRIRANQGLLKRIEDALDRGQFCLFYQPKVDCRAGRILGFEALIRWQHPVLGLRSPAEFLPLIEHDDIIVRLGEWVIGEALRQMAQWRAEGIDLSVSVNVSVRQFLRGGFDERLAEMLGHYPPEMAQRLELELVETAALEDVNAVRAVMRHHQGSGVRFALDDFGTGYSSLVHLKRLAVDVLKIDQTFVRDMLDDPGDLAIVQGVIGLATAFRHHVVAEGVENIEHVLMLLELGCDVMQGYGIARPMPAANVAPWVRSFHSDPRWRVASSHFPMRSDFDLLMMEVAHRHWLEKLRAATLQIEDRPPPEYDHCRLTQWYADVGRRRYGRLPEFRAIDAPHREVHRHAETLLACYRSSDDQLAKDTLDALEQSSSELLARLHRLRLTLAGSDAAASSYISEENLPS